LVELRLNVAETLPFAVPLVACSVIQLPFGVEAVQPHPAALVTAMLIVWLYPDAGMAVGSIEVLHGRPACVTT
jgi:hypothetical protein